jgi:hypothetical protein
MVVVISLVDLLERSCVRMCLVMLSRIELLETNCSWSLNNASYSPSNEMHRLLYSIARSSSRQISISVVFEEVY